MVAVLGLLRFCIDLCYLRCIRFHYIISLEYSIQCNSRSGTPEIGRSVIDKCYDEHPVYSYDE